MGSSEPIEVSCKDGVAHVELHRPERKNAITGPLAKSLHDTVRTLAEDTDAKVLLLTGAGGAFCSGLDLKEFNREPRPDWLPDFSETWTSTHVALFEFPKPIVVALERYAINGGAALALAADLLIAGRGAFLQVGEVQQGMAAPMNLAWLRLRHSEAVTAQLTLIGRRFGGEELLRLGIACACVEDDAVATRAHELAHEIARFPPEGARQIKAASRRLGIAPDARTWFDTARDINPLPASDGQRTWSPRAAEPGRGQ